MSSECRARGRGGRQSLPASARLLTPVTPAPPLVCNASMLAKTRRVQAVITVVAHLCARLLESSSESRAAIRIQRAYRAYRMPTGRGSPGYRERASSAVLAQEDGVQDAGVAGPGSPAMSPLASVQEGSRRPSEVSREAAG